MGRNTKTLSRISSFPRKVVGQSQILTKWRITFLAVHVCRQGRRIKPWKTSVLHQQFPSTATLSQRPKWNISLEWQISLFNMEKETWSYLVALWSLLNHITLNSLQEWISPFTNEAIKPCSPWPEEPQQERNFWERGVERAGAAKQYDNTGFTKYFIQVCSPHFYDERPHFKNRVLCLCKRPITFIVSVLIH